MAALLQAETGSGRPVLLKYDTQLGHTGARPISQSIEDLTDEFSECSVDIMRIDGGLPLVSDNASTHNVHTLATRLTVGLSN